MIAIVVSGTTVLGSIGALLEGDLGVAVWGLLPGPLLAVSIGWYRSNEDEITYSIVLTTASGESQVLASQDWDWIDQVNTALNDAIIARG